MESHNEIVSKIEDVFNSVEEDSIVSAFVGSLSTKNLPARSAFGSYIVLQNFQSHPFQESEHFQSVHCRYCGLKEENPNPVTDENVANYPYQVRHTNIKYALYDLETFSKRKVDSPSLKDTEILNKIFDSIRALPENAQLTELQKSVQGTFKSNKYQRMIMLETFGYAGILQPKNCKNFNNEFLSFDFINSEQPAEFFKREWEYPIRFWTGADGLNEKNVKKYFGSYL